MRTLSLIIVTFTYLLVGAAIFDALEGPNNEKVKEGLVQLREKLKLKYEMTEDDYKMMEVLIEEKKPHKTGPQWNGTQEWGTNSFPKQSKLKVKSPSALSNTLTVVEFVLKQSVL